MNNHLKIAATISTIALLSFVALPVFAQTNASASAMPANMPGMHMGSMTRMNGESSAQRLQDMQTRGSQAITARVTSLNNLLGRIQDMKNLSDTEKTTFQATLQNEISEMTALQSKIQADTSTTSLRADLQTIAPAYRIYILIDPQVSILAAADRISTIVNSLQAISGKLQTRLSTATTLSTLSTLEADLSDMNTQITNANTVAQAATAEVVGLQPDNGVASVQASNTAALKDARAKIKTATQDLQAADKDAKAIVAGLKGTGTSASVSASASTSSTGQ